MAGMADLSQQTERTQDYGNKWLIAKVVENRDPNTLHRIKVEVPDILEGDPDVLPWCIPNIIAGGAGAEEVSQNIPRIGSAVYVMFQDGDIHFPMYGSQVMDFSIDLGVLAVNYPSRKGWVRRGHHFFVDHATEEMEYLHPTGMKINVATNGDVLIHTPAKLTMHSDGDMEISTNQNMVIRAGQSMSVEAGTNMTQKAGNIMTKIAQFIFHRKG